MLPLEGWFQYFYEFVDEDKYNDALALFEKAETYAKENHIELLPGWHRTKARLDAKMSVSQKLEKTNEELSKVLKEKKTKKPKIKKEANI